MRLNAPTQLFFFISLALVVLALLSAFMHIPVVSGYSLWTALAGYAVLAAGNLFKGM